MKSFLSRVTAVYAAFLLALPLNLQALAAPPSPTPTRTPSMEHFQDEKWQACNTVCDSIVGQDGRMIDINGDGNWDDVDHQWCARHGISRGGFPANTELSPASNAQNCSYYLEHDETCEGVEEKVLRCDMYGSEIYNRCLAYKQGREVLEEQITMIALDTVAAGICTVACVVGVTGALQQWGTACQISGTAVGLAQGIATAFLTQNDYATAASVISAAGGTVGGMALVAKAIPDSPTRTSSATVTRETGGAEGGPTSETTVSQENDDGETALTCGMAALYAGTAILRAGNMASVEISRAQMCEDISVRVETAQRFFIRNMGGGGRRSGGSFGIAGGPGLGRQSGRSDNPFQNPVNVQSIEDALNNPRVSAATDAQLFNRTGLGNGIKNRVPALAPGILAAAARGDNAGMFAAALPKQAAAMAGPLASVGENLASKLKGSGAPMLAHFGSYTGGGSGGRSPGSDSNPFAAFGAKNTKGAGGGVGAAMDFGVAAESTDIWHSNTDLNIFQIVSGRIDRVQRKQAFR